MSRFRKLLGVPKTRKAGDVAGGISSTTATLPEEKPGLYSTEGSNGMKVVADPSNSVLEYVLPQT